MVLFSLNGRCIRGRGIGRRGNREGTGGWGKRVFSLVIFPFRAFLFLPPPPFFLACFLILRGRLNLTTVSND